MEKIESNLNMRKAFNDALTKGKSLTQKIVLGYTILLSALSVGVLITYAFESVRVVSDALDRKSVV